MTTLLRPDSGVVRVGDYDVVREAQSVRSMIGLAGQYPAVDENLTGKENLEMIGLLYHLGKQKARTEALNYWKFLSWLMLPIVESKLTVAACGAGLTWQRLCCQSTDSLSG